MRNSAPVNLRDTYRVMMQLYHFDFDPVFMGTIVKHSAQDPFSRQLSELRVAINSTIYAAILAQLQGSEVFRSVAQ